MTGRNLAALLLAVLALAGCGESTAPGIRVADMEVHSRPSTGTWPSGVVVPAGGGRRPLLVAFPDGGDDKYWDDGASGDWGRYVMREVVPQVARSFGTDRRRAAIGGISMGGFGAFDLARLHPGRFCAVGGHSPALWRTGGETAPGAFDDAGDFARHDVVASPEPLTGMPVWLDAGDKDPFRPGDDAFAAALRRAGADASVHVWPGGHDRDCWDAHWSDYLRFYARALERC